MKYILTNAFVLSGQKDMKLEKKDILVEDGIITEISDRISPNGIKTIDLSRKYLLPGLINMHVHLPGSGMPKDTSKQNKEMVQKLLKNKLTRFIVYKLCEGFAKTELRSGVTTIRTVGGLSDFDSKIRNTKSKYLPRVLASNMAVSVPEGHMAGVLAYEAKTEEDAVNYVNMIAKTKPDLIKLMITGGVLDAKVKGEPGVLKMPLELVKAATDRAHLLGYKVAAHVESKEGVKTALLAGVDTIEHGAKPDQEIIELFKKTGSSDICTISPAVPLAKLPIEYTKASDLVRYNGEIVFNGIVDCAKACLENGILVGLGTDTACPFVTHYDMWRELAYFEKHCGVSKEFAIHTATLVNAQIAGIDDITGSVTVGKSADFLIVEKNPLESLSNLRNPFMVINKGEIITKPKNKKYAYVEKALDDYLGI